MWIFWSDFWVEFWEVSFGRWVSRAWIFQGASFAGKNRVKKFEPRIRVQNSGVQNSFHRIRAWIRVPEARNPLCRLLSLTNFGRWKTFKICWKVPVKYLGLSPSTVGPPDWFQEWLRIKAHRFFPITLPTVLGDALRVSPSTAGSPHWFPEWLRIKAHRFSQSLYQPYSEAPVKYF